MSCSRKQLVQRHEESLGLEQNRQTAACVTIACLW